MRTVLTATKDTLSSGGNYPVMPKKMAYQGRIYEVLPTFTGEIIGFEGLRPGSHWGNEPSFQQVRDGGKVIERGQVVMFYGAPAWA